MDKEGFAIIGAGLAGCECALTLARHGFYVTIFEQKPAFRSEAHVSNLLAELVCSNSLRSNDPGRGVGLLKQEMRALDSAVINAAYKHRVAAGQALAVDREAFSASLTNEILANKNIELICDRIDSFEDERLLKAGKKGIILAAGPMISENLASELAQITGQDNCYFYDAIAPVVWSDSLDMNIVFRASRYGEPDDGDYLNCPMNKEEYTAFYTALRSGETFKAHDFEKEKHFEGCMPVETLAARGEQTLTYGPMKPVGLIDPRNGKRPWAVLQLRPEKANMETCNLVGCQTKLLQGEQKRIFRMIPGMAEAEFARFGSMHRNTYVNAPEALNDDLSLRKKPGLYLAGQITGVEGYVESAACGLWLGLYLSAKNRGKILQAPPEETALGSLLAHLRRPCKKFQPSNANFGLMPELAEKVKKKERREAYQKRGEKYFSEWLKKMNIG